MVQPREHTEKNSEILQMNLFNFLKEYKLMFKKILSLVLCFSLLTALGIPFNATASTKQEVIPEKETFKSRFSSDANLIVE